MGHLRDMDHPEILIFVGVTGRCITSHTGGQGVLYTKAFSFPWPWPHSSTSELKCWVKDPDYQGLEKGWKRHENPRS
jgi:hypothetical protein